MENEVKIWQGQLRTIKHYVESRIGKVVELGSALFTWLIPFCADLLNKLRVGAGGHTAYERMTSHACNVAHIGFAEVVDFKLKTDKHNRYKADSEFNEGVFLGYAWRSTEYPIASQGGIYNCRTVRRRADDIAFSLALIENLEVPFEEYTLKGTKTSMHISFPKIPGGDNLTQIPTRGPGMIPRRLLPNAERCC